MILKKYRILHLTANLPGPLAVSRLASAGAQVTKIEPPTGDPLEGYYPDWYRSLHQGQNILKLDLKDSTSLTRMDEYLGKAHLFVTSVRPLALQKAGLDEVSLRSRFPKLSFIFLQGYPAPHENEPSHDLTCQAEAGLVSPGVLPRALIADFAAAERIFSASLLALLGFENGGAPTSTTITLAEMAQEFATPWKMGMTTPEGPLGGCLPQYQLYEAKDGWIALAALEPHFLKRALEVLALDAPDREKFTRKFREKTRAEWEALAKERDIPLVALK